jgi:O-antigen/teichoic acid export membrane protein
MRLPSIRHGVVGATLKMVAGVGAGQSVLLLASPVLTRLYSPAEFGVFAVVIALVALLAVVSSLRLELAVPLAMSDRAARDVLSAALSSSLVISVAVTVVLLVAHGPIVILLGGASYEWVVWLVPVGAITYATFDVLSQYLVRQRRYGDLGRRSLGQSIAISCLQVFFGLLAVPAGLLVGQFGGKAVVAGAVGRKVFVRRRVPVARWSWRRYVATIKDFRRFPLLLMPSAFLNTLGLQLPILLVAPLFGAATAGALALSQRLLSAPAALLGQAVANVFMGERAAARRQSLAQGKGPFLKASVALVGAGTIIFGLVAALAPVLVPAIFGPGWATAGAFTQALCVAVWAQFIAVPLSQSLIIEGKQSWQLMWDAGRLVVVAVSIVVPAALGLQPIAALWTFAAASAASYACLWLLCFIAIDSEKTRTATAM